MSELDKRLMQTPDLNKERLETLKTLFPDLFTVEGRLNPDELKKIIDPELVKETERFEFKWFGKSEAKRNAFTPGKATLVYDEDRSVNPEYADGNMIIEGENLETLKCLLAAYRERIKCIYIDPPYNTGNDFVYSDRWDEDKENYWEHIGVTVDGVKVDTNSEASGRYHSNWLNMMYSRLLVARQLLKNDGVMFISIDDDEVHHLRKLCDEVFGQENFVAQFIWKSRQNKDNRALTGVSTDHEYIICYTKNHEIRALKGSGRKIEQYSNPDDDERGFWVSSNMVGLKSELERPNLHYDLINTKTGINYGKPAMGWRYDKNTMNRLIQENRIIWPESKDGRPRRKVFLSELDENLPGFSSIVGEDVFTRNGTVEIEQLFERRVFDFPKPSSIIAELVDQAVDDGDIILDFFAGSGSTGQAAFNICRQNGRRVSFILVQIPEATNESSVAYNANFKTISDITIERNKRVIRQMEEEESTTKDTEDSKRENDLFAEKSDDSLRDARAFRVRKTGFKVYKLAKSNFPRIDFAPDPTKTEEENLALLDRYIQEKEAMFLAMIDEKNIFDEVLLKNGFMLNYAKTPEASFSRNKVYRINDNFKECLVCMDISPIDKQTLKDLEAHKEIIFICLGRSLDTTMKWNLKHLLGDKLIAF